MNEVYIRLVQINFDNLENSDARSETELGVFVDEDNLTAQGKIGLYFQEQMEPKKLYLGWDDNVYPQFRLEYGVLK